MARIDTAAVPLRPDQQSGLEELAGSSPFAHNVVIEPNGAVRRRPGITTYSGAVQSVVDENGIVGLHVSSAGNLYAVGGTVDGGAPIYRVTDSAVDEITAPDTRLRGGARPIIAETEMLLVLAAGGAPHKVELLTSQASLLGGSPPSASHVVAHASRLVLNDTVTDKTVGHYSEPTRGLVTFAPHETWSGVGTSTGQFGADAKPDRLVAIASNTSAIWLFGPESVQLFGSDPRYIFAPIGVNALEIGCAAPYSIISAGDDFFWLDDRRRLVRSTGRGFEVISGPAIARTLQDLPAVTDCYGYFVKHGFVDALVWTFPTAGKTLVYQIGGGWSQWQGWNTARGSWGAFPVTAHHQVSGSAESLVGTADGYIGRLSHAAHTDLDAPINASIRTGFVNRGSSRQKQCNAVRLTLRRGETTGSSAPSGILRWRDSLGGFNGGIPVSLGRSGEHTTTVAFYSLGTYRQRQWEFEFSGTDELVLAGIEEDFTTLDY